MFLPTAVGAALLCITGVSAFDSKHDGLNTNRQLDCYRESDCAFLKNYQCKPGYENVGFDQGTCGRPFYGQPICCSTETVQSFGNKRCEWKGLGPNCAGAGEAGEVNLFKSGNGGYPTEGNRGLSDDQCHTGYKYFACPLPHWQELVSECRVTACDEGCVQTRMRSLLWQTTNLADAATPHPERSIAARSRMRHHSVIVTGLAKAIATTTPAIPTKSPLCAVNGGTPQRVVVSPSI